MHAEKRHSRATPKSGRTFFQMTRRTVNVFFAVMSLVVLDAGCHKMAKSAQCFSGSDCAAGQTCVNGYCEGGVSTDIDSQCIGKRDFTTCIFETQPDRAYDICVSEDCVSPGCGDISCNTPGPDFPLPDTNLRKCYDNDTEMTCPNEGDAFYGQDAQYGLDLTMDESDRFTRLVIGGDDRVPVIEDTVTGLMWQGCLEGKQGDACTPVEGSTITMGRMWEAALLYCEGLTLDGFDDWRVPDAYELSTLMNLGNPNNIVFDIFQEPDTHALWTASTHPGSHGAHAIKIVFGFSVSHQAKTSNKNVNVRCVRGKATPTPTRFVVSRINEKETIVSDEFTHLQWQGCPNDEMGFHCSSTSGVTWKDALGYCETLVLGGLPNWRLPNLFELRSILSARDDTLVLEPTLTSEDAQLFWTSTTHAYAPDKAWTVSFTHGGSDPSLKADHLLVRCVRDFQQADRFF